MKHSKFYHFLDNNDLLNLIIHQKYEQKSYLSLENFEYLAKCKRNLS